ncbi:hypothetical protein VF14_15470 [Nostoc linckia z18]|uniref:Uncharacterized protein n=4 Tax=Nostoc linckia TaxID=92942 RepID=A0A9Q5Z6Y5_NOSLI|nr:hypothetical protein VF05_35295 [Nostoc linckia z3]PHJ59159.1 hypothetical protein VF02_25815 [Nostoc linckia z1]PHJ60548.1 hypothetical protein VF03_33250 [Nostoc linckia z2]PHJ74432.1 hypothetical protein VF06_34765 [Nostoc linckia z4]PHJ77854.1 hypothetical protein VF07_35725 [Nostoc linckia z6]PHJ90302.1 hypothetical protein VF04_31095 [Nostoc linckia z7]PHJ96947.1 hypothetical protein VF08_29610 [Nostoc linckia z8]PHK05044.1 hypothetical protein VF09_27450 [Nostoc linckia z9]PHK1585
MQLDAFTIQLDAFIMQLDAFIMQLDAFTMQFDAFTMQFDAFTMQLDAFTMQLDATKKLYSLFLIPNAPCPMTAVAPLGETPRPHCLPHAPILKICQVNMPSLTEAVTIIK